MFNVSMNVVFLILTFILSFSPVSAEPFKLSAELQAGSTYDNANLPPARITGWTRIPAFWAGTTIRTSVKNGLGISIKSARERTRGKQIDANGNIWMPDLPITYEIDRRNITQHIYLAQEEVTAANDNKVTVILHIIEIQERKRDHKIIRTTQGEELHSFTPGAGNTINAAILASTQYDANGKLLSNGPASDTYIERLIAPFECIDQDEKHNYRRSFANYLNAINCPDLMPN